MSGGGVIIIKKKLKAVAELDLVKDSTVEPRKARLLSILAKDEGEWTGSDFRFVVRCIAEAHDDNE